MAAELAISSSLRDLSYDRCPIADVIECKPLVERIFAEYQLLKRLGVRSDTSIPAEYLTALDLELQAIELRDREHREKMRKAREMRARRR